MTAIDNQAAAYILLAAIALVSVGWWAASMRGWRWFG